jgi:hypothetical protein
MRNEGVIASVSVTALSDEGERVTTRHKYQPKPDEVQRKAREAIDRWCAAIWVVGVEVTYVGGRVDPVKVPRSEQDEEQGGGDGRGPDPV